MNWGRDIFLKPTLQKLDWIGLRANSGKKKKNQILEMEKNFTLK